MNEHPDHLKLQRPKHFVARAIGVALALSIAFAFCKLMGIDTERFWPFMTVVVGGSFVGNILGVYFAQKIAAK